MALLERLMERLRSHPKRIVFPEGGDPRILQAAREFAKNNLGVPILLGDRTEIKAKAAALGISLEHIRIIEPSRSDEMEHLAGKFRGLQRFSNLKAKEAEDYLLNNNYFATMMLATGQASALVSGATASASSAIRPLLRIIPLQKEVDTVSSVQILDLDDSTLGINGTLFLGDCAVIPQPDEKQIADLALTAAGICYHITNERPRVAMLAFSSKSSNSRVPAIMRMKAATDLCHEKARKLFFDFDVDGELQVDAALNPHVAEAKGIQSSVAGKANVLIFPSLNAGNIAIKMIQTIARCRTYGPVLTGLSKPAAEISRGANAHDIFGTAVVVGCQAIDQQLLHPTRDHAQ
ncbi:MAG: phosphate acetyltransferase [Opitutales bacterium]|nr:phosphate acetyltransferase [Opitutales bacterium]NRA25922.1 phosphate acetyltransferase [Opitutales bacterium]